MRESHQNSTNKTIHWICVPSIFFSIVGLVASIPSQPVQSILGVGNPYANWAAVVLILILIYYVSLSIPLSIGMMLFAALCLFVDKSYSSIDQCSTLGNKPGYFFCSMDWTVLWS